MNQWAEEWILSVNDDAVKGYNTDDAEERALLLDGDWEVVDGKS